jgi:hypothetical protein
MISVPQMSMNECIPRSSPMCDGLDRSMHKPDPVCHGTTVENAGPVLVTGYRRHCLSTRMAGVSGCRTVRPAGAWR